jgi:hypothetical protein
MGKKFLENFGKLDNVLSHRKLPLVDINPPSPLFSVFIYLLYMKFIITESQSLRMGRFITEENIPTETDYLHWKLPKKM